METNILARCSQHFYKIIWFQYYSDSKTRNFRPEFMLIFSDNNSSSSADIILPRAECGVSRPAFIDDQRPAFEANQSGHKNRQARMTEIQN